ncbi:Lactonase, 7-bladed beta-propeller-domain-containing protein [Scenedesmus sp. NREL 46B-D3]|nr:Lactonase, 7-bladed beta-propeller-domain-containing protein [Scenedesmus sp. NREL 46B-D3]
MTATELSQEAAHAPGTLVFLGTYTDYSVLPHYPYGTPSGENHGLVVARFNHGKLLPLRTVKALNPAFMKYHPYLNVLYVLSECIDRNGYLTAYSVEGRTGELSELGCVEMTGKSTCYISFDKGARHAVITNYWDGVLNVVELDGSTGAPLGLVQSHQQTRRETWRQVQDRADHMANRQDGPHAHCNVFHPSYRWVFVPDLGDNCIHQYGYEGGRLTPQVHVPLAPGDGPRHFVFHPKLPVAFSGCELGSRLQVFAVDDSNPNEVRPRIQPLESHPTLPEGFASTNYVGEIKVDAEGRFVYVSNRGHNSIAVFEVDQASGRVTPDSDMVKTFSVCSKTGRLAPVAGADLSLNSPNFVLFVRPHPEARVVNPTLSGLTASVMAAASHAASGHQVEHTAEEGILASPTAMVACS